MANKYHPKCVCQTRLVDGVCPHGCEQHRKPAVRAQAAERQVRERAHRERVSREWIGLSADNARDAYEKSGLEKGYSKLRAQGAERARRGWARKGVVK